MNIAVIIFGQPRFVNNPYCFSSQKDLIFSQGNVDVFAHLWRPQGKSYQYSSWAEMNECPASLKDLDTFYDKWKPLAMQEESHVDFRNDIVFQEIKKRFPEFHWTEDDFNKALSHLYSLEKAIEVFEQRKTKDYDWVIFLRTDVCVWEFPQLDKLEKDKFYYSSLFSIEHFADLCFITSPKYVSGLKAFSHLSQSYDKMIPKLLKPCAEQFKKETFMSMYGKDPLSQVPIPVRIVRSLNDKGSRW